MILTGIETEYGILRENTPNFDPFDVSSNLVQNVDQSFTSSWWDRQIGTSSPAEVKIKDVEFSSDYDIAMRNGGRLYIDHGHPEVSTPECKKIKDLLAADKAGELILDRACKKLNVVTPDNNKVKVFKNNSDFKGHSYGCHENYLLTATTYESLFGRKKHKLFCYLIPFLVTRQIFCGSGKTGTESGLESVDYQISQRADFFETTIGLQTTHNRPIINTRDEPHADPARFRRLHVIVGDSNMSEYTTFLKVGTTQIILQLLESGQLKNSVILEDPVEAAKQISRDPDMKALVHLENGKRISAIEIQEIFLEAAHQFFNENELTSELEFVLREWETVLDYLKNDQGKLSTKIDWIIKKTFLSRQVQKSNLDWQAPRIRELDIRYHDICRETGIFYMLENKGLVDTIIDNEDIVFAIDNPPLDTRAYFRGKCIDKFANHIHRIDWEAIQFKDNLTILLPDPLKSHTATINTAMSEATSTSEFLARISHLEGIE